MLMKNACYLQDVNNPCWLTFPQNWWHWALSTSNRDQCSAYGFQSGWCTWWRGGDRSYKSKCQQIFKKNSAFWWRLFIVSRDHCQFTGTLIIVFKYVDCSCQRKLVWSLLWISFCLVSYLQANKISFLFPSQRPESVKIDARDVTGARFTVNLSGLPARVFQHEFDHLQVRPTFLVRLLICRLQDTKRPMLIEGLADRKQTRIPLFGQNVTKF